MKKWNSGYSGENERLIRLNEKILITRDSDQPYLYRRTLLSIGKWFSIKLHTIVADDAECDHDHPWPFLTIILSGGYFEWTPEDQPDSGVVLERRLSVDGIMESKRWHGPLSIMYRPATHRHRLKLSGGRPAKTLVFTGKVIKSWGFFTSGGFLNWKEYIETEHC